MTNVSLDDEEWQRVMAIVAQAPWNVANPLLMRIGEQLRQHQVDDHSGSRLSGNSKMQETPAAEAQLASKGTH